jgi:amino-acid N-acetyltransferase
MIRNARVSDIPSIYSLLNHFSDHGLLLGRSLSSLYDHVRDFKVFETAKNDSSKPGEIVGVAALHVCWDDLAEIRSLAVADEFQGRGIGMSLVQHCLDEVKSLGVKRVFSLTYQPDFFEKMAFTLIDKDKLPHKVWSDCLQCPKFPDCNEVALIWNSGKTETAES